MMAGQPLTKSRKVTALEEEALCLAMDVFSEVPKKYLEKPSQHVICKAWNDVVAATQITSIAIRKLGELLRAKAGVTEPGPWEKILLDDGDPYTPVPRDWSLESVCARIGRGERHEYNSNGNEHNSNQHLTDTPATKPHLASAKEAVKPQERNGDNGE